MYVLYYHQPFLKKLIFSSQVLIFVHISISSLLGLDSMIFKKVVCVVVQPPLSLPLPCFPFSLSARCVCVCVSRGCVYLRGCSGEGTQDWHGSGTRLIPHTCRQFSSVSSARLLYQAAASNWPPDCSVTHLVSIAFPGSL